MEERSCKNLKEGKKTEIKKSDAIKEFNEQKERAQSVNSIVTSSVKRVVYHADPQAKLIPTDE